MYEIINVSVTFISPDKLKNPYSSLITPKYLFFTYIFGIIWRALLSKILVKDYIYLL